MLFVGTVRYDNLLVVDCYSSGVNVLNTFLVRYNLDPFKEHSDSELWTALERAHLRQMVSSIEGRGEQNSLFPVRTKSFQKRSTTAGVPRSTSIFITGFSGFSNQLAKKQARDYVLSINL